MNRVLRLAVLVIAVAGLTGCYRTVYTNLHAPAPEPAAQSNEGYQPSSGWQHFFLFGWIPIWRTIPADQICGGTSNIKEIRTRETFLEGLINQAADVVYSPWNGQVVCYAPPASPAATSAAK